LLLCIHYPFNIEASVFLNGVHWLLCVKLKYMTKKELREKFIYKDGNLIRKTRTRGGKIGAIVGCDSGQGYIRVYWKSKLIFAHKAIWIMHNGEIPDGMQIDHINGIRSDNRLENLRLVTHKENHKNKKTPNTNTSGIVGVDYKKERDRWRATIFDENRRIFLGYFKEFDKAVKARKKAEKVYSYHPNHGR
jgi:hypothetical protein